MTTEHLYKVAGLTFAISSECLPGPRQSLPSFVPFACDGLQDGSPCVFHVGLIPESVLSCEKGEALESLHTQLGQMTVCPCGDGWRLEVQTPSGRLHLLQTDSGFTRAGVLIQWDDPLAGPALSSMLRVVFSQASIAYDTISLHASVVACRGRAYLFMGKSGTGKSTHSRLWLRNLPGASLLNDDNPSVRLVNGAPIAFGTPWSGKTPCYKNEQYPVGGMVRLEQAGENRFIPRHDVEAFVAILPGCAAFPGNAQLYSRLCDNIVHIASLVTTGTLQCLPDDAAAVLCARSLGVAT